MSHLGVVCPIDISFASTFGPAYSTDVVMTDGGWEQRNQNFTYPLHRGELSYAARVKHKEAELLALFHMARGKLHTFNVKDWSDFSVPDNSGVGVFVMIDSTHFQAAKEYGTGTYKLTRKITRLKSTISVTGGAGVSVSYTTGIVTVSSGTPTAWTGEFYVPCRFDIDEMSREIIDRSHDGLIMGWGQVPIVEVRE